MKIYHVRDERARINRTFYTTEQPTEVLYSDSFSYIAQRTIYREDFGEVMGLEKKVVEDV